MNSREKGYYYEEKSIKYLKEQGLDFVEKNYYGKLGEIDLIFQENQTLIFVEVKYRKTNYFGSGAEAVNKKKARRIYLTAMEYLKNNRADDVQIRFDLISIDDTKIGWIKNVIWGDEIGF